MPDFVSCLQWTDQQDTPRVFQLSAEQIVIGRRDDADLVLTHPHVSRQHAKIAHEKGSFAILDLGSTHGTFVNGNRIQHHELQSHDRIRLGQQGIELIYLTGGGDPTGGLDLLGGGLERSFRGFATHYPMEISAHSDLEKISCVLDFHYCFGKNFSTEKTFEQILKSMLEISGAERGFILRAQKSEFVYMAGLDGAGTLLPQSDFRASQGVVRRVEEQVQPVFVTAGMAGDLASRESVVSMKVRAIACLPLEAISQQTGAPTLLGILYLDSQRDMHSLTGLDHRILTKLAEEAAHVLEKVELIETLDERRRIDRELALAQETQRHLMPSSLPVFDPFRVHALCRPTRHVGGDFYDFLPLESGELMGVLADVSGKGISAALLSSLVQGALNMEFRSMARPDQILKRVNRFLFQKTPMSRFVTCFLFVLKSCGDGEFLSAGHNPAYVFRAATGVIDELASSGIPLGTFEFSSYCCEPFRLEPGDILVIYSDGLTEAENPQEEMFGEERLRALIASAAPSGSAALEDALLAEISKFTEGYPQTDDITFVVVQRVAECATGVGDA